MNSSKKKNLTKRILIYGFPFFLISLESILREALSLSSNTFIGPTLAAVGISLLLSLIVPKNRDSGLSEKTKMEVAKLGILVIPENEQILIDLVWIFIFVLTASWMYCLYLSSASPTTSWGKIPIPIPAYQLLGFLNYFIGVIFSELKEVV